MKKVFWLLIILVVCVFFGCSQNDEKLEDKVVKCTITYVVDGNKEVVEVYENQEDFKLKKPYKTGYTFEGWYLDEELTLSYEGAEDIDEDLVLYAKFVKNGKKYKILSSSMEPTLKYGKIYEFVEVDYTELKIGDIILYKFDNENMAASRIVEIKTDEKGTYFVLKGDANMAPNIEVYRPEDVVGRLK